MGYPIVRSYGAQRDEAVVVSVGSTILTDIASLVVLATAIGLGKQTFSWGNLFGLISSVGIFALTIVTVIRIIGRRIFSEPSMTKVAFS